MTFALNTLLDVVTHAKNSSGINVMADTKRVNTIAEEKLRQDFIYEMRETTLDYYVNFFRFDAQDFYKVNRSMEVDYELRKNSNKRPI